MKKTETGEKRTNKAPILPESPKGTYASEIMTRLQTIHPELKTALSFTSPFEMLVATILSAQTTDLHVNRVTEPLFLKYRSVGDYAEVSQEELENDLRSVNYYRTKAKHIRESAALIRDRFHSEVPRTMADLVTLPGVARKTANIVLSNAYGINEGIAVDTHVRRLAGRLGLSGSNDPVKIEQDLMTLFPREDWADVTHILIAHGRSVCTARNPDHSKCILADICPSSESRSG